MGKSMSFSLCWGLLKNLISSQCGTFTSALKKKLLLKGYFGIDWWFRTGLSWPTVKFNIHVVTHYYFSVET